MYETARTATLVAATIATGLSAGLFFAFSCSVMPGLRKADDRTLVETMQRINVAILNGWFLLVYIGALLLTAATTALHLRADGHGVLPWLIAAFVLYLALLVITGAANIPLNNQLAAAGPADEHADLASVRARFEAAWVRFNLLRALAGTAALGCLAWGLVLHGRIPGGV